MLDNRRSNLLHSVALLYIITWLLAPPLAYGTIYRVLFVVAIGLIGVSTLNSGNGYYSRVFLGVLLLIGYFSLLCVFNGTSLTYKFAEYIFMLCAALIVPYFCMSDCVSKYNYLVIYAFLLCIVFNCTTIQGIAANSNIMRDLVRNTDFSQVYARRGIGGYGYCYSVLLLIPIALEYVFDRSAGIIRRAVSLIFLVSTYYMVFMSAYFLAIIIAVSCLPLHFILRIEDKSIRFLAIVVLLIASIFLYANMESFVYMLTRSMDQGTIKRKLLELVSVSQGESGIENGEFAERYSRYMKDLKYTFSSPLWGTLDRDNGNHSFILDRFASYGIIVATFYYTRIKKMLNAYGYWYTSATRTLVIISGILLLMNSLAPGVSVALFVVAPIYSLGKREQMEYE